jgi:hypothetical protein
MQNIYNFSLASQNAETRPPSCTFSFTAPVNLCSKLARASSKSASTFCGKSIRTTSACTHRTMSMRARPRVRCMSSISVSEGRKRSVFRSAVFRFQGVARLKRHVFVSPISGYIFVSPVSGRSSFTGARFRLPGFRCTFSLARCQG